MTLVVWLVLITAFYVVGWRGAAIATDKHRTAFDKTGISHERYVRLARLRMAILGATTIPTIAAATVSVRDLTLLQSTLVLVGAGIAGWLLAELALRLFERRESTRGVVSDYQAVRRAMKEGAQ